jgi:hypothetical protein
MTDIAPLLGVLARAVGVADMVPYVGDTLRGTTRPHRGTWPIWGALAVVVSFVPVRRRRVLGPDHDRATGALLNSLVFALSIRRPRRRRDDRRAGHGRGRGRAASWAG